MPDPRRAVAALLAASVLGAGGVVACDGGEGGGQAPRSEPPSSIAAFPAEPHVTGRRAVLVQPGLAVMTDDPCDGLHDRVCSADGKRSWAPIGTPAQATLVEATTRIDDEHTSWTTVLRLDPGDTRALARTAGTAADAGGVVLVETPDHVVLVDARPDRVAGSRIVFEGLDKPTAWGLVEAFSP
jgi:hypothetical protein